MTASSVHRTLSLFSIPRSNSPDNDHQRMTILERNSTEQVDEVLIPAFDKALGTRNAAIAGLLFSAVAGGVFIIFGFFVRGTTAVYSCTPLTRTIVPLSLNILVLIITQMLGSIHSVSCRWSLLAENRLDFNANARFLTCAKHSFTNGPIFNTVMLFCIGISYMSSSLILLPKPPSPPDELKSISILDPRIQNATSVTRSGPLALGTAILIQSALCTWLLTTRWIPSWSSDPLNTARIAMCKGIRFVREEGRCMMPVHHRRRLNAPTTPKGKQLSICAARRGVRGVLALNASVLGLLVVLAIVVVVCGFEGERGKAWAFVPGSVLSSLPSSALDTDEANRLTRTIIAFKPALSAPAAFSEDFALPTLLIMTLLSFPILLSLHASGLSITLARDEKFWRAIATPRGSLSPSSYQSALVPFTYIPNIALLLFEPIIMWLFQLSISLSLPSTVLIRIPHLVYLAATYAVFCAFVAGVSLWRGQGMFPASFGHVRTMVDVVDEWGGVGERMYWGDKGEREGWEGVRRAGTASSYLRVDDVREGVLYF